MIPVSQDRLGIVPRGAMQHELISALTRVFNTPRRMTRPKRGDRIR
jgi:hypothetical protein